MTRIKVCGITNINDALVACEAGADAVGFIFAKSPRQVKAQQAAEIIKDLPPYVSTVGVFVNEEAEVIRQIAAECNLQLVQLHGDEDKKFIDDLYLPAIRAFSVKDDSVIEQIEKYDVDRFMLDSFSPDMAGGSGKTFDWEIAEKASRLGKLILAGGLSIDNIEDALNGCKPYGVDLSSSVEKAPGIKDHDQLRSFIRKVQEWDCQQS